MGYKDESLMDCGYFYIPYPDMEEDGCPKRNQFLKMKMNDPQRSLKKNTCRKKILPACQRTSSSVAIDVDGPESHLESRRISLTLTRSNLDAPTAVSGVGSNAPNVGCHHK